MADLSTWHAALASVATAQARVLWIGDSILEGTGATTRAKRSQDLMLAAMAATHPVAGQGISQYLPQHYAIPSTITPWAPDWADSTSGTITDQNSGTNCYGLGMRSGRFGTNAVATYTVTGTDLDIWTNASGSFQYAIDGGSYSTTINTAGQNAYAEITQVHLGASGSHTVSIKRISGTVNFLGVTAYDGGRSKGIAGFDYSHYGATVPDFYATGATQINATFSRNLALVDPHLVVLLIGANDAQVYTVAEWVTNFNNMLTAIQTALPSASIVMTIVYNQQPLPTVIGGGGTYAEYIDAARGVAAANSIPLLNLPDYMPNVWTDTAGYYQADGQHLTDAGHALMAQAMGAFIDPLQVEPLTVIGYGAVASTNSATTDPVNTRASGSSIIAISTGAVASASSLTLTDNKGNTYTQVDTLDYAGAYSTALWKCENALGGTGHTFTQGGGGSRQGLSVMEIINGQPTGFIRAFNGTTTIGGTGPWSSGNVTGVAGDFVVGLGSYDYSTNPQTATAGSGYTLDTESTEATFLHTVIEHQTLASSGSVGAAFSAPPSGGGAFVFVAALKPANAVNVALSGHSTTVTGGAVSVAASDVTVALTGRSVTVARGAFGTTRSRAMTGKRVTDTHGTLAPAAARAVTGQSEAVTGGSVTAVSGGITLTLAGLGAAVAGGDVQPGHASALSSLSASLSQGAPLPGFEAALAGQSLTVSAGAVEAVPEVRVALSGRSMSVQMGTVVPQHAQAVTGQDATYALGTLTAVADHSVSVALGGQTVVATSGAVVGEHVRAVAGQSAALSGGTITAVAGHNVTVALAGFELSAVPGSVAPAASPVLDSQRIAVALGLLAPARTTAVTGAQEAFVVGTLKARSGILITEPHRTAMFPVDQRGAVFPADVRAARFVA